MTSVSVPPTPPPSPPPCTFDLTLSQFVSLPLHDPLRARYLVNLFASLHPSELSYLHTSLQDSPRLKRDFLRDLPKELALYIASYLDAEDLVRMGHVSSEWREIVLNESLWRALARSDRDGNTLNQMVKWRLKCCDIGNSSFSYRRLFTETARIKREWEDEGGGTLLRVHNSPDNATITSTALSSDYVVVALNNPSVHIFSIRTGKLIRTLSTPPQLNGREGTWAVNLVLGTKDARGAGGWSASRNTTPGWGTYESLVVTGGCERALRVWELESGRCLLILHGHRATIRCLVTLPGKPITISGSRDTTIRVWNIAAGRLLHTLRGHSDAVRCIDAPANPPEEGQPNLVASGSYDRTVRVWNIDNGQCLHVFNGHTQNVYCVLFSAVLNGDRYVASCGLDTSVRVWDTVTGKCKAALNSHTSLVSQLVFTPTKLISGSAEGKITVFDMTPEDGKAENPQNEGTPDPTQDIKIQLSRTIRLRSTPVNSLAVEDDFPFVVVGGGQGRVSIVPHPLKDQPTTNTEEQAPAIPQEPMVSLSGEGIEGSRFLHGNPSTPGGMRRVTRIHKIAVSPDGSRCIVGGDGKGGTYIEFWAFDRFRYSAPDRTAMEIDENAMLWHEMDAPSASGSNQADGGPKRTEDPMNMDMEFLPVPHTAENLQPLGNNVGGGLFTY